MVLFKKLLTKDDRGIASWEGGGRGKQTQQPEILHDKLCSDFLRFIIFFKQTVEDLKETKKIDLGFLAPFLTHATLEHESLIRFLFFSIFLFLSSPVFLVSWWSSIS